VASLLGNHANGVDKPMTDLEAIALFAEIFGGLTLITVIAIIAEIRATTRRAHIRRRI